MAVHRTVAALARSLVAALCASAPALYAQPASPAPADPPCSEFLRLLSAPKGQGIERLVPKTSEVRGTRRFLDIDLDGDGKPDVIAAGCPAALRAQNQCVLEVSPSSGGGYSLQESNLHIVRLKGGVYAVSSETGPGRQVGAGKVLRLTAQAPRSTCTGL